MAGGDQPRGAGRGIGRDLGAAVIHMDFVPALGQRMRCGDTDDTGPEDGDLHGVSWVGVVVGVAQHF